METNAELKTFMDESRKDTRKDIDALYCDLRMYQLATEKRLFALEASIKTPRPQSERVHTSSSKVAIPTGPTDATMEHTEFKADMKEDSETISDSFSKLQDIQAQLNSELQHRSVCADLKDPKYLEMSGDNDFLALLRELVGEVSKLQDIPTQLHREKQEAADASQCAAQTACQTLGMQFQALEYRCASLEGRLMESLNFQTSSADRILDRVCRLESVLTKREGESGEKENKVQSQDDERQARSQDPRAQPHGDELQARVVTHEDQRLMDIEELTEQDSAQSATADEVAEELQKSDLVSRPEDRGVGSASIQSTPSFTPAPVDSRRAHMSAEPPTQISSPPESCSPTSSYLGSAVLPNPPAIRAPEGGRFDGASRARFCQPEAPFQRDPLIRSRGPSSSMSKSHAQLPGIAQQKGNALPRTSPQQHKIPSIVGMLSPPNSAPKFFWPAATQLVPSEKCRMGERSRSARRVPEENEVGESSRLLVASASPRLFASRAGDAEKKTTIDMVQQPQTFKALFSPRSTCPLLMKEVGSPAKMSPRVSCPVPKRELASPMGVKHISM